MIPARLLLALATVATPLAPVGAALNAVAIYLILPTAAAAKPRPVTAGRVQREWPAGAVGKFSAGADRRTVVDVIGPPDHRCGDTLWIYYDCGTSGDDPRATGLDALLIVFKQNRVAVIRLVDSAVLRNLIAQEKLQVTGPSYADLLR